MNTAFFIAFTRLEQGLKLLVSYREGQCHWALNQDDALWRIAKDLLRKIGQLGAPDLLEQLSGSATSDKRLLVLHPLQAALCFLASSLESFPPINATYYRLRH